MIKENGVVWLPVRMIGMENYEASSQGDIRVLDKIGNIKYPNIHKYGNKYLYIIKWISETKTAKSYSIHRLVCSAFHDVPEIKKDEKLFMNLRHDDIPFIVNHKDGDKTNNAPSNLEWISASGNNNHAYQNMLNKTSVVIEVRDIIDGTKKRFISISELIKVFIVSKERIGSIISIHDNQNNPYQGRYVFNVIREDSRTDNKVIKNIEDAKDKDIAIFDYVNKKLIIVGSANKASIITSVNERVIRDRYGKESYITTWRKPIAGYEFFLVSDVFKHNLKMVDYDDKKAKYERDTYLNAVSSGLTSYMRKMERKCLTDNTVVEFNSMKEAARDSGIPYKLLKGSIANHKHNNVVIVISDYAYRWKDTPHSWNNQYKVKPKNIT